MDFSALIGQVGAPLVAFAVPIIVAFVKMKLIPKIPSVALPIVAMALGIGGDLLLAKISAYAGGNLMVGAALGLMGVGVREVFDQLKKALLG